MFDEYINEYIFSGSLPETASTYVKREADDELYEALKQGKFCYVLNSRQSGKSSLRVRTMSHLSEAGVECASIDLSSISIQSATQENWYADLIVKLIDSFDLNVDFKDWWEKNQLNSSLLRFGNFLEKILLSEIQENIVIFIDEIDSVLSLKFPTDDFFAFIRSCYNQRVDNPDYNRLTFCLLGVASPSNLIEDKKRTPFNIGKAIALKGFQLHEVEPLERGLQERYPDSHGVMKDILHWTGGQPFLTQKLCQFMVEESLKDNARTVEQVVRARIIENWESQDEPEHFRTIRDRILRDEQRAGYLLELYQQIRDSEEQAEITVDDTPEQSELQLSGLVVRQQNQLKVYNSIYRNVFDQDWIETQLRNLRPYSENFKFWLISGAIDESRLLRGKALQEALEWSKNKNLSYQDREFLAASQKKEKEEEITALEKEAELERERKDRAAAEKRNQVLAEANRKAQQRISIGGIILVMTLLGAVISGSLAWKQVQTARSEVSTAKNQANKAKNEVNKAEQRLKEANNEADIAKDELKKTKHQAKVAQQETNKERERVKEARKEVSKANAQLQQARLKTQQAANKAQVALKNQQQAEKALTTAQTGEARAKTKAQKAQREVEIAHKYLIKINALAQNLSLLSDLSGNLQSKNKQDEADEARKQLGLSYAFKNNYKLQQALLYSSIAFAYNNLEDKDKAIIAIQNSLKQLQDKDLENSPQEKEARLYVLKIKGTVFKKEKNYQVAIDAYKEAWDLLQSNSILFNPLNSKKTQIFTTKDVELIHQELIGLLSHEFSKNSDLLSHVRKSLINHYYAEIEYLMKVGNWRLADLKTTLLILYIAKREEDQDSSLDPKSANNFSCQALKTIDSLWVKYSNGRFGFSVQKRIWVETGNKLSDRPEDTNYQAYLRFAERVGWYDSNREGRGLLEGRESYLNYPEEYIFDKEKAKNGHLPIALAGKVGNGYVSRANRQVFRVHICKL